MSISIAPGLDLPVEAATETFAILGKRGSGKTSTAVVLVEQLVNAGQPVVVLDPVGVWWGLRSSASGTDEGLPVVIFGGDHADVPLERTAGELIANVIIDQRISAVLDLSHLSKTAARTFVADFLERLYHRNREALHVVVDEADLFAPQRAVRGAERLLGSMEDMVRRGRARGIGVTLITQRPASLHKDVLSQAEVLVTLRMTGPRDVAAIDEWVRLHADEDEARTVKASLPSLAIGEAWFWSPGWLSILQRVQVRKRATFDSSATPKAGQRVRAPKRMAAVDIAALGEQIAATVEKAKADDPRALRAHVADLERQLAEKPEPVIQRVEVPVLAEDLVIRLEGVLDDLKKHGQQAVDVSQDMLDQLRRWADKSVPVPPARRAPVAAVAQAAPRATPLIQSSDVTMGKTERNILTVLIQHGSLTHAQIALLSGYSVKASTIGVALSKLRKAGLVDSNGQPVSATQEGIDFLGQNVEPLPQGEELLTYWRNRFGATERNVLDALIGQWPNETSQRDVAELTGYSPTASTIGVALSKLRKVGVVIGWRLSDDFASAVGLQ